MSKELTPLEALEKIKKLYKNYEIKIGLNEKDILGFDLCFAYIEKELKALEIIKKSIVATADIPQVKTPIGDFVEITLAVTKDELDLLKEVLL